MKRLFPEMKELFFDDDTFTADPKRAREIAKGLGKLGITWSTNSRANVDRETLKALKDGGLRLFVVGYESGNEQILRNIRKGVSVERARRFTSDCHDLGILIHGTFILGLPGETRDTIEETMRFAHEMRARDAAGVARVAVPGHRDVRLGTRERLPHGRQPGRRDRLPEVHRELSRGLGGRDLPRGRDLLSAATTSAVATSGSRSRRWRATARRRKRLLGEGRQFLGSMWKRRQIRRHGEDARAAGDGAQT